jgi:hypothetical protein
MGGKPELDLIVERSDGAPVLGVRDKREHDALMSLVPYVRDRVINIILELRAAGHQPYCIEGLRSRERQVQLKRDGFTKTLQSLHLKGKAADIVDADLFWGASRAFWAALGSACRHNGLLWGGAWKGFYDPAHVEYRGLKIG